MTLEANSSAVAHQICKVLGETRLGPRRQIWQLVQRYGVERCLQWLEEALAIEQQGGDLTVAGVPRTRGGTFFALVRRATKDGRRRRWGSRKPPRAAAALPSFQWQE